MSSLDIRLFGGLQISHNNLPVTGFISNKAAALFVYLALTGRPHQRDALAGLLWGELAETDAKNNLRQALANLRKLVEPYLIITRDSVAFEPTAPHTLDTRTFEQQLQAGRDRPAEIRFQLLQEAANLYQGDFLAGFFVREAPDFEEWLLAQRLHYRELAIHALYTVTQYHLERGQYGRAIDTATRLLALDAWREESHRQLMLAQLRSGQRSAALAQYENCRRLLSQELGVHPSAETTALYERIRDAQRIIVLPPTSNPLLGRARELSRIAQLLADPSGRIITLSGPGGCGKSRLAAEAAGRAVQSFLHGVCFVPLAAAQSLDVVPGAIAEALNISLSGKIAPREQLVALLRSKELLLVLDNLEHLAGADEWVGYVSQCCPHLRLLVTSRERLNLRGEHLIELDGLNGDGPAGDSATQLFLERARESVPTFALDSQTEPAVRQICLLVNGLPLAIELAAAKVRYLDCAEIATEIEQNLSFLATGQKNVPPRHRSLLAAFEHSWALLSAEEQTAFAQLSVFRGGWQREAAMAVGGCHLPVLASLADKSLIRRDPAGRYTIHELLRQYAELKLQASPYLQVAKDNHCAYYVAFLKAREQLISDQHRKEITTEIANIRAAWNWALSQHRPERLAPALESLRLFFEWIGWYEEAANLFEAALQLAPPNSFLAAQLRLRQGWFYHRLDRFEQATPLIEQALPFLDEQSAEKALCFQCLGNICRAAGRFAQATACYQQSLTLHRLVGNPLYIAASLNGLATAYAEQGDFDEARQLHQESLALRRKIGDRQGIATVLVNLGFLALGQAQYEAVKPLEQEALLIFRDIGYPMGQAVALNNLGVAHLMLGEYHEARPFLEECLDICRALGHRHIASHALGSLGGVAIGLGQYQLAWQYNQESLQTAQEIGSVSATLYAVLGMASLSERQGINMEQAIEWATLVFHHPSTNRETKNRAAHLLTQLESQLPPSLFAQAHQRGQTQSLEMVVAKIFATNLATNGNELGAN